MLANSTLLKKVSHSSQELREDNIRGTFLGNDIMRELQGIENIPDNFRRLFEIHKKIGFSKNLPRLVKATQEIAAKKEQAILSSKEKKIIRSSPQRAISFLKSRYYRELQRQLDESVAQNEHALICASFIENSNIRARVIEYIIAGKDEVLRYNLIKLLKQSNNAELPAVRADRELGDYIRNFDGFHTATDIKTKIMYLESHPKGYNLDKVMKFLATEKSVFMFYFVGFNKQQEISTALISMFHSSLLSKYRLSHHWSGKNSRGTFQLDGKAVKEVLISKKNKIVLKEARELIEKFLSL